MINRTFDTDPLKIQKNFLNDAEKVTVWFSSDAVWDLGPNRPPMSKRWETNVDVKGRHLSYNDRYVMD